MSKFCPILFSAPMVRAILAGSKTQTRRGLKLRGYKEFGPSTTIGYDWHFRRADKGWRDFKNCDLLKLLPIQVGDRLWVREAWRAESSMMDHIPPSRISKASQLFFEADGAWGADKTIGKLRPGVFMPRWVSRITLEVTAVKVERLNEISDDDALAEGVEGAVGATAGIDTDIDGDYWPGGPVRMFRRLWESINGPGSWEANPWVAVYSFRRVT